MFLGIHGAHHTTNHPYWHGGITCLFGAGLISLAALMSYTCTADEALANPDITYYDYHVCEVQVSGAAYALAFLSILRQIVSTLLDSFLLLPGHRLSSHGDGHCNGTSSGSNHGVRNNGHDSDSVPASNKLYKQRLPRPASDTVSTLSPLHQADAFRI